MKLEVLGRAPLLMTFAWLGLAAAVFSWSVGHDQDIYLEIMANFNRRGRPPAAAPPPPAAAEVPASPPSPAAAPAPAPAEAPGPPPEPQAPEPAAPLVFPDPPPAVWELQAMEVVRNDPDYFEARFAYHGGRLTSRLSYQTSVQPVWIIDLPADWRFKLENNYHWPKGLVRRLAVGLHHGYLRLVLYHRPLQGGLGAAPPLVKAIDQKTFSITLKSPADGERAPADDH
ncbi:MAG: hypothetical protein LBS31_13310 [Candidatus Adiutrix sp.]|jgi:hypothetical protein|nr:hypothetical protein [Candidatus Adiutrix sp.]